MTYEILAHICYNNEYECNTEGYKKFEKDIFDFLANEYDIPKKAATIIFNSAWEKGHSTGYYAVLDYVDEYASMCCQVNMILEGVV